MDLTSQTLNFFFKWLLNLLSKNISLSWRVLFILVYVVKFAVWRPWRMWFRCKSKNSHIKMCALVKASRDNWRTCRTYLFSTLETEKRIRPRILFFHAVRLLKLLFCIFLENCLGSLAFPSTYCYQAAANVLCRSKLFEGAEAEITTLG